MDDQLDVNKVAAEFISQNIDNFYATGKDILKGATDRVRLLLSSSYKNYLTTVTERYSKAKSFFIRHQALYLYDFYVPMGLNSEGANIPKASLDAIFRINPFAVITGTGGSGKTMLMRHLFIDAVLVKEKVPIYLELRELNASEQTVIEFLKETLHTNNFTLDDEYIDRALKAGHFVLLLDGFDELARDRRKSVIRQIQKLAKDYDRLNIIVSSRPDNEFSGWQSFAVFAVASLELDQACDLVKKLPFESELKNKFIRDLRDRLFRTHESFLSNPLLLSIMLLTYGESADIPSKLNVFYNQAYEALFQRHDALKSAFQRDRRTNLDIQDFGNMFAAFCTQTYDKRIFQMERSTALEFIEKAKRLCGIEVVSEDYLVDAQQAVCLLVEEGLLIAFSHRSFQEYFVARFIANSNPAVQQKLIDRYAVNLGQDQVMQLLYEMNPELIERLLVIPRLEKIEASIGLKNKMGITHYLRFLKLLWETVYIEDGRPSRLYPTPRNRAENLTDLVFFTLNNFGTLVGWKEWGPAAPDEEKTWGKYAVGNAVVSFAVKDLTLRDPVVRDLANYGSFVSQPTLEALFKIKDALIKKHEQALESLDRILGSS